MFNLMYEYNSYLDDNMAKSLADQYSLEDAFCPVKYEFILLAKEENLGFNDEDAESIYCFVEKHCGKSVADELANSFVRGYRENLHYRIIDLLLGVDAIDFGKRRNIRQAVKYVSNFICDYGVFDDQYQIYFSATYKVSEKSVSLICNIKDLKDDSVYSITL